MHEIQDDPDNQLWVVKVDIVPSILGGQVSGPGGQAGQFLLHPRPARSLPARCHHGQRQGAERGRLAGGSGEHEGFPHGDTPLAG